ncbi:MAG: hypothetical protein WAL08_18820, partial [Candidatus Sulfotelmatobacter sp.]
FYRRNVTGWLQTDKFLVNGRHSVIQIWRGSGIGGRRRTVSRTSLAVAHDPKPSHKTATII